jgi:hypothetical protein
MSTQYRLVQSGKTASGGCSAGQSCSATYYYYYYKELRVNSKTQKQLNIGNQSTESVDSFIYLGSVVTTEGDAMEDVSNRIGKANSAQLYPVWKNSNIFRKSKLRIFSSNVKAVLLYGAETWKSNTDTRIKLQTFINKCLRKILNIHWSEKIRSQELLELAGEEPVQTHIKRRKWRWMGHTLRKSDDAMEKQAIDWNPQRARKRRRKTTWNRTNGML